RSAFTASGDSKQGYREGSDSDVISELAVAELGSHAKALPCGEDDKQARVYQTTSIPSVNLRVIRCQRSDCRHSLSLRRYRPMSIRLLANGSGGAHGLTVDDDGLLDDAARLAEVVAEAADNPHLLRYTQRSGDMQCLRAAQERIKDFRATRSTPAA